MNKVALITGARRGIGRAISYKFAENGYDLIIDDREELEKLNELKKDIEKTYGVKVLVQLVDISIEEQVDQMLQDVKKVFGKVDVLVNNAGIVYDMPLEERSVKIFNETINNNLTGTFIMCKKFGESMLENKNGKIINISSTNGINCCFPTSIDYDASKAGIISLTNNFALAYAPYINVNAIAPGWVNTEMNADLPEDLIEEETSKIYLKRFAEPEEVANLVYFLASDDASYINNAVIKIDGGY